MGFGEIIAEDGVSPVLLSGVMYVSMEVDVHSMMVGVLLVFLEMYGVLSVVLAPEIRGHPSVFMRRLCSCTACQQLNSSTGTLALPRPYLVVLTYSPSLKI